MILTFLWPSSNIRTGGVTMFYEFANGMARRGHEVNFIHGPLNKHRISSLDELDCFDFNASISHYLADTLDDPGLPAADIIFNGHAPAHLGLPCPFIQGFGMLLPEFERESFRVRAPKVCVAHWLTDVGRDFGVPDEQLWHVPCGIDHELFNPGDPPPERTIDIAALRHPHPNKGWDVALETLHELQSRRPNLRGTVFSAYKPREVLPPGTQFLECPTHRQLADNVYRVSRVFLQTSRQEGFGLTPVEAMSCGAALVTTNNGGSREYAIDGQTALVADSEDVMGLADAVETLLDDDEKRSRIASAGHAHCLRFDWDRNAAMLEEHLERYLTDPGHYQAAPADLPEPEAS